VKVQFTVMRNGMVKDIQLAESSGNRALDMSAVRAVYDAGQLPPLPAAYEKDQARIEFWFELKR
jgi:TonB family protein